MFVLRSFLGISLRRVGVFDANQNAASDGVVVVPPRSGLALRLMSSQRSGTGLVFFRPSSFCGR